MQAAREAAAKVARDFYADAILKGRCDSDELVLACATAIVVERERCVEKIVHVKKSVVGVYGKRSRFDQYATDRHFRDACQICKEAITGEDAEAWQPVESAVSRRGDTP